MAVFLFGLAVYEFQVYSSEREIVLLFIYLRILLLPLPISEFMPFPFSTDFCYQFKFMNAKKIARAILPTRVKKWIRKERNPENAAYFANRSASETFSEIYRSNVWGGTGERFYSGSGSDDEIAEKYIEAVIEVFEKYRPKIVVDLGCGDFRVASKFVRPTFRYIGVDVVPELIQHHNERYSNEQIEFRNLDASAEELPDGDICLIRQVLQHLSNFEIAEILRKCEKYRYLIVTEHFPPENANFTPNLDMPHGADTRLKKNSAVCIDLPPFCLANIKEIAEVKVADNTVIRTFLVIQDQSK